MYHLFVTAYFVTTCTFFPVFAKSFVPPKKRSMSRDQDSFYSMSEGSRSKSPSHQRKAVNGQDNDGPAVAVHEKYACGDSYEGTVVRRGGTAVKEGSGRYQFANGSVYEGQWHKGTMHGKGVFFEADTMDRFEGIWSYGRRVKGVYYFPNGDLFIGAFDVATGNKKHGRCVLVDDLVPYDAEYNEDVLVWKEPLQTQSIARKLALNTADSSKPASKRPSTGRRSATRSASPSAAQLLGNGPTQPPPPSMDQLTAAKLVLRSNRDKTLRGASPADLRTFSSVQRGSFDRFASMPNDHVKEALRYYRK